MNILTSGTPEYLATEMAKKLPTSCNKLGLNLTIKPNAAIGWPRARLMKPLLILDHLMGESDPFWWVDADDQVLAPFGEPPENVAVGLVQNPERKVIKTDLWLASCVIYFRPCPFAVTFLRLWDALCEHAPNDHRALVSAYYCSTFPGCNNGLQDVTDCVSGKFIMTGHAERPDARI